jgi:hypothetical protein
MSRLATTCHVTSRQSRHVWSRPGVSSLVLAIMSGWGSSSHVESSRGSPVRFRQVLSRLVEAVGSGLVMLCRVQAVMSDQVWSRQVSSGPDMSCQALAVTSSKVWSWRVRSCQGSPVASR